MTPQHTEARLRHAANPGSSLDDAPRTKTGSQAIERALEVLLCFEEVAELSATQIAARTGLPVATAHRMIRALRRAGLVEQEPATERYRLGVRVAVLGRLAQERLQFVIAIPLVEELAAATGEAVNLGVQVGHESLIVHHVPSVHALRVVQHPGIRTPLHACAMGKIFLAFGSSSYPASALRSATPNTITTPDRLEAEMKKTRDRGYSLNQEEWTVGVRAIGAPVHGPSGRVAAAIALQAPAQRLDSARQEELAPLVLATAARLSEALSAASATRA